jgi:peptidyl-prolyl cis-trans isomerase SurA
MQLPLKKIVLITFLFITLIPLAHSQNGSKLIDQIVAVVGNKKILQSDIESQRMQFRARGMNSENIRCDILEEMINQKLLLMQAEIDSVQVSSNQVESQLDMRLRYFIRQIGSREKLEQYYNKSIPEIRQDFRELLREQLRTQKMRRQIIQDVTVSPAEVKSFYQQMPEDSIPVINKKIQIAQIVKYPEQSYEAERQARQRLLDLRERIQKGEKFSTLAVLYSEDRGTSSKGGELGFRTAEELDPAYADAAFSLQEGEVSSVVESAYGYHIIKLMERRGDEINTRHILIKPKIKPQQKQKVITKLDSLATEIRKGNIPFEKAAIEHSDDKKYKLNGGLLVNPNNASNEFELDELPQPDYNAVKDLKVGEVSDPYEAKDEKGQSIFKIVKLVSKTERHKANLKQDFSRLSQLAKQHKQQQIIKEWLNKKRQETYIHIDNKFKHCNITVQ